MTNRWEDYVIAYGGEADPPEALWEAASLACGGVTMYVLGVGFDPRCLVGLQQFLGRTHALAPIVLRVELPPPSPASDPAARGLATENASAFEQLCEGRDVRMLAYPDLHDPSNAGPAIARGLTDPSMISEVKHLIIDVSSLPSSLYFPMIAAALRAADTAGFVFPEEIQVVACENPDVDAAIRELGVGEASVVGGFRERLEQSVDRRGRTIWAPVVGEHAGPSLNAIHTFLAPDDICPVLPFPARHPRRADALLLEHQFELMETFQVTPSNVIYADERNPFDLYRTLSRLQESYQLALTSLSPTTTVVISSHSSKLLSIGALLAAYEHKLPIVGAGATDYNLESVDFSELGAENKVACMWLVGEPDR